VASLCLSRPAVTPCPRPPTPIREAPWVWFPPTFPCRPQSQPLCQAPRTAAPSALHEHSRTPALVEGNEMPVVPGVGARLRDDIGLPLPPASSWEIKHSTMNDP
jgi:hypothetical protein